MSKAPLSSSAMARLRTSAAALGPSERRVAAVILEHGGDVVEWSTQQVAERARTSSATVIRACQNLGFRGFQHLRLELARLAEAVPGGFPEPESPLDELFTAAHDSLTVGRDSLDPASLARAVELLASARRVVLAGNGFSAPPLQDAAMRFATIGRPVEAPSDILAQQFAAHSLGPEDVCLALSHSGANAHTLATCRVVTQRGARLIVLCSYSQSPIVRLADVVLITGATAHHHGVDPFFARLASFVTLYALHNELEARLGSTDPTEMREVVADALAESAD